MRSQALASANSLALWVMLPGNWTMKKILFGGLIVLPVACIGQRDLNGYDTTGLVLNRKLTDYAWGIKAGYIYHGDHIIELGILRQRYHHDLYYHPGELYGTSGPSLACEINLDSNKDIIGPKIAFETTFLRFLEAKANLIYYTDFTEASLCFTPELGLSFFGFVVLSSRYSIPISNRDLLFNDSLEAAGVSVVINFPVKFRRSTIGELRKRDK